MLRDPRGDTQARRIAFQGALVGLLLAAALLGPAFASGGVPARGDLPDFFWPMKAYGAERWASGAVPLWNPLSGNGEPWLAQLQTASLYPGDLPFLLGWREGAFLGIAFHLALAAAGAAFWLWELGGSRPASLLAGGLFAGGGAFLSLVPVYNNACTAAWLPWLFAGARRAVIGRSRGAGFAVAVAGAFLAGEPALAAAGGVAALAVALVSGTEGEPLSSAASARRLAMRGTLPLVAGLLLAGAVLVPFGALLQASQRRSRVTREEAVARPVGPSDLADLVAAPQPAVTRDVAKGRGGYLITLALGPLAILLAAGAGAGLPGRRRLLLAVSAVGVMGFLLALGASGHLVPFLFDAGLLHGIRFPARWFVFPHLILALAAGAGLDGWLWGRFVGRRSGVREDADDAEVREEAARRRVAIVVLGSGLTLVVLLAAGASSISEIRDARDPARTLAGVAALLAGAAAVVIARRKPGGASPAAAALVAGCVLAPLPFLAGEPLAALPARAVGGEPAVLEGLARGPEAGRVFAPAAQDRVLAMRWKHAGESGWGENAVKRASAALAGYTNLFHGLATTGSASPIGNPLSDRLASAALAGGDATGLLALLNARHVLTPFPARAPGFRLVAEREGVRLYELPAAYGRAFFPQECRVVTDDVAFETLRRPDFDAGRVALAAAPEDGTDLPPARSARGWAAATFRSDEPERAELTTSASSPSLLVLTRSWDRGWKAEIDGEPAPILRVHLAFLGVVVPAGEHRLELVYRPTSFRVGLAVSAVGLLAVLALALSAPPGGRAR